MSRRRARRTRAIDAPFGSREGERAAMAWRDADGHLRRGLVVDVYLAPLR